MPHLSVFEWFVVIVGTFSAAVAVVLCVIASGKPEVPSDADVNAKVDQLNRDHSDRANFSALALRRRNPR